jgi:S-methylmethionine-dependent homocysteine/selenocysteine methylase
MKPLVLLDGGMGQEIVRRSGETPHPLWSVQVMFDRPDIVRGAHIDFIRAGARVITVNAYTATRPRMARVNAEDRFAEAQALACRIAAEARDATGEDVAIAGCLPPLYASYRPELGRDVADAAPQFREIAELQAHHVDLLIAETMPSAAEARAAALGAQGLGLPLWISWTLEEGGGGRLRSGETVAAAAAALDGLDVAGFLVNCAPPEDIDAAMPQLAALGKPFGGYGNGFKPIPKSYGAGSTVSELSARTDLDPDAYADHAMGWADAGAAIVGGCCEIGPAHIARLAERLTAAGYVPGKALP